MPVKPERQRLPEILEWSITSSGKAMISVPGSSPITSPMSLRVSTMNGTSAARIHKVVLARPSRRHKPPREVMDKRIPVTLAQHVFQCRLIHGMHHRHIVEPAPVSGGAFLRKPRGNIDIVATVHRRRITTRIPAGNVPELLQRSRHQIGRISEDCRVIQVRVQFDTRLP